MDPFDAELHLRMLGERMLIGSDEAWGSPLSMAARALVAVEAIGGDTAEAILDDYTLATALREGDVDDYSLRAHRSSRPTLPVELKPRRVVACDREIDIGGDTLHVRSVSLADDSTTIAVTYRMQQAQPRRPHGYAAMMLRGGAVFGPGGQLHQIRLADDRGTNVATHFSGGGTDDQLRGRLHADRPLAKDTSWIEVEGERIDLEDAPPAGEVVIEPLDDQPAALRHLWALLAAPNRFHGPPADLDPVIDVLIAAGALDPADPGLADVRAVASAIGPHQGLPGAPRGRRLPEPWRSTFARRGRTDGPSGTATIGRVTPRFDGIVVAAMSLESGPEEFAVEVEVAPDVAMDDPFDDSGLSQPLVWWARDDRGNHYLGHMDDWSGGDGSGWGDISFDPALDPQATRLDLMPTAETSRAVISFQLPWAVS